MHRIYFLITVMVLAAAATSAFGQTIDNFESGDLSAWYIKAPWYTELNLVSPGAGGSGQALAIQEITGSTGSHSQNALAHRCFETPANWNSYVTLEMDAMVSSAEWNGYSILIYNDDAGVLLRGIHSDSSISGFRTVSFDISGISRDKITEIVLYVNKTKLDEGQIITIDNLRLSTTPVAKDPVRVLTNFSSSDMTYWQAPISPPYVSTVSHVAENSPTDTSSPPGALSAKLNAGATSTSALVRWRPPQTMDLYEYKTLEFDAKLASGTNTDGFSVRLYNAGASIRIRKFVPDTSGYATFRMDISRLQRDQVNEILFYINRSGANSQQEVRIDNIRLTDTPLPPVPDVVMIDDFDTYGSDAQMQDWWNAAHGTSTYRMLVDDAISQPNALDIILMGTSSSAYATRSVLDSNPGTGTTQDWSDYRTLMFEAKVVPGDENPNYPIGFSLNTVSGPANSQIWFYPSGYDNWETIAVDISGVDLDQMNLIRFYHNRCQRNTMGESLRIDNVRLTKEPAPAINIADPNIDDFEDGDIADWYYRSYHEYPADSGVYVDGVTHELVTDAASGNYALAITPQNPPASTSAYLRKTVHAKWSDYKTLQFDAKVVNASTSEGFTVRVRDFGTLHPEHSFYPTAEWQTFKMDISGDGARAEIIGLLFYVNGPNSLGLTQTGTLLLDNIVLTNETLQKTFDNISDLQTIGDGATVTLNGKVCTGGFVEAVPDRSKPATLRTIVFLEEDDRSAAIPVVLGEGALTELAEGTRVNVTGLLTHGMGVRYIYATEVIVLEEDAAVPAPVALRHSSCGDSEGIPGFVGVDTTGMLAVVTGRVVDIDGPNMQKHYYLYIDDGSQVSSDNDRIGLHVIDVTDDGGWAIAENVGRFARVTGFVMNTPELNPVTERPTGKMVRAIWPKAELADSVSFVTD